MSSVSSYAEGRVINERYVLGQKLGRDGHVYKAFDRILEREVALKFLEPNQGQAQSWDEAQRLESLRSRFLIDVINADVVAGSDVRFIATPVVDSGDLESLAAPHGLSVREAVRYTQQIASGIDRIHAAGMIHRDIKPANALKDGDGVFVSDLEYCEILVDGRADANGSFCTVAPEVLLEHYCSIRSEVYSLGATAFYLLSGEYPVNHRIPLTKQKEMIEAGQIRELRTLAPHVTQAVGTVIRKALRFDPEQRYAAAEEFSNALAHAARNSRDWQRVAHDGHMHCLRGGPFNGRGGVAVCSAEVEDMVEVSARYSAKARRVAGIADVKVKARDLPKHLQKLVKALR